jgi:hypothetical protein
LRTDKLNIGVSDPKKSVGRPKNKVAVNNPEEEELKDDTFKSEQAFFRALKDSL